MACLVQCASLTLPSGCNSAAISNITVCTHREANVNLTYADVTGVEGDESDGNTTSLDTVKATSVLERSLLFHFCGLSDMTVAHAGRRTSI